ncbi:MAG: class I SAM-dependent methyltransferase [Deltaproteobacteria bacterium]|nr:class I SAM-dependent methyltransferase [Deltaproteobacteria bacterium]
MSRRQRFDDWPERYDRWFATPVGKAVLSYERALVLDMLQPAAGDRLLDAGSGTGIFTRAFLAAGARVTGVDIAFPMLRRAAEQTAFPAVVADMQALPFVDGFFDKTVSVAALEFIADEKRAVAELFRVTKAGGIVVVATLNSLSPWAVRRLEKARHDRSSIFSQVWFRSPRQLLEAAPLAGGVRTAVHFGKEADPAAIDRIEKAGQGQETGAFVAARWVKP